MEVAMPKPTILFITTDEQHLDTVYSRQLPYEIPVVFTPVRLVQ